VAGERIRGRRFEGGTTGTTGGGKRFQAFRRSPFLLDVVGRAGGGRRRKRFQAIRENRSSRGAIGAGEEGAGEEERRGEEVPGDSRRSPLAGCLQAGFVGPGGPGGGKRFQVIREGLPSLGAFRSLLPAEFYLQPSSRARLPALAEEIRRKSDEIEVSPGLTMSRIALKSGT